MNYINNVSLFVRRYPAILTVIAVALFLTTGCEGGGGDDGL